MNQFRNACQTMIETKACYMCKHFLQTEVIRDGFCNKLKQFQPYSWWRLEWHKKATPEYTKCKGTEFILGGPFYDATKKYL